MKRIALTILAACAVVGLKAEEDAAAAAAAQTTAIGLTKYDMIVHDPVMIREDGVYYLFTTGPGVTVWSSEDMIRWKREEPVFAEAPDWAKREVPGFNGHIWAPDISEHEGKFYLYYSISSFGKNNSCIGLAINETLDPSSEDFEWVDQGIVVQSHPGLNNWNAIDANLVEDDEGRPYLAFGSFWSGLKIGQLTEDRTRFMTPLDELITIASRSPESVEQGREDGFPLEAGKGDIEGPFIVKRGDYYYLFASTGYCCRGRESTYRMVYGRSEKVTGPYLDKAGLDMTHGGGTLLLEGNDAWNGVGHNGVSRFDGVDYLVFHGYDASTKRGLPKLHVETLAWDEDGWPYVAD